MPPFGSNQLSLFSFKGVMTNSLNSLDILGLQYERKKNEDQKSHAKRRALKPRYQSNTALLLIDLVKTGI